MIHLGLIGHPLGHSLSPKLHTAALRSCGLEGDYSLFPIQPDDRQGLKDLLTRVRTGEIAGLNVTIPHKQNVIEFMDELTPTAKAIGAINTIYLRENKLIGDNTDAQGFLMDLKRFLDMECKGLPASQNALVLGAGGSARAVTHALLADEWKVTLHARRLEQARELAESFKDGPLSIGDDLSNIELSDVSLVVNATPLGMSPNVDRSPWPEDLPFPPHAAIYDLVYNPRETKLMKDALVEGLPATTGLGMLIEQAALAFEIWTGKQVSREDMLPALEDS
jgi:shikimate dehydrogenase